MEPDAASALRAHYLKVQALSPVSDGSIVAAPTPTPDPFIGFFTQNPTSAAFIIFITCLVIGIVALLITKARNVNTILTLLFLAFTTSAIPYGTSLIQQQTRLQSQASPVRVPKNVIIDQVESTHFIISWDTDIETLGAVRLKTSLATTEIPRIIPEPEGPPNTKHTISVDHLTANTVYYVEVLSGSEWYNNNGSALTVKTSR